jgi:hypothetical protein
MGLIFDTMLAFFTQDNWNFTQAQDETALNLAVSGKNGKWRCHAQAREEQSQFLFYSICETAVPEAKRAEIAEFVNRANYDLVIGNFEMSFRGGEIRYRTSIDVEGDRLNQPLIKNVVYANVVMMDRYLPGILAIINGDVTPETAIQMIER